MKLNNAQQEVIDSISGNIAVIATAGSGKTTVLTKRIENMVNHNINPSSILAVTFSKKAKESISDKLSKLNIFNVNVETFHSLALKIIIHKYGNTYKVWTTQWEKEKCIQDICISLGLCNKDDIPYNEICVFITRQKINMITDNFIYSDDDPFSFDEMRSIYLKYEEFKKYKNYIEFDDFLNIANTIIDSFPEEKKYFQSKFEYILSDEFQDISMSQSLLLKKLNDTNTMIVGDPLQAIYSFRGGKSEYILNFDREYNNTKIINLNTNYRCSNNIVKTANALAEDIPDSKHRYYVKSFANNPDNTNPQYNIYSNEYEEAENIADKIIKISKSYDYDYKDIAILARTNAQLTKIQSIFHTSHGGYISTIRNNTANVANSPQFGSGIAFGLDDTHGYLYLNYSSAEAYLGGGNQDKLNWIKRIAFTDSTVANATKVNNHTVNADVPSGAKFTDTNTWRPLGTTADTACAGNDSRLSNARPANGGTSTYANYVYATSHQGSWYQNSQWDGTYFQTNYKNGNNVLPMKVGYSGHADSAGSVAWSNVSGRPSSMPASDVYAWAKASTKPSYSWGEITGKPNSFTPASHTHNYAGSSSVGGAANKAIGVVDYNDSNRTIKIGYTGDSLKSSEIGFIAGYANINSSTCIKDISKDQLLAWLGLNSLITTGYNDTMWSTASGNMYYYIKFSTGIMIMVTIVPDGWGSNEPVYTYPVSFINDRYALIAVDNTSSSSGQTFDRRIPYLWYTKSSFQIYTDSPVSDFYNEGMDDSMSVICIGRWK